MNKIRQGPIQPLYIEDWTPYYSMDDLDRFGMPESWGVYDYGVVEGQPIMEAVWEPSRNNKIHYYDRVDRFRMTLYHLLGLNGRVKWEVILAIHKSGWDKRPDKVWNSIRAVLKKTGYTAYYNRIPTILEIMGYDRCIDWGGSEVLEACMDDFIRMSNRFSGEGYFPNLRFTALRIMMLNGVEFGYDIPVLRTKRKIAGAIEIFDELYF